MIVVGKFEREILVVSSGDKIDELLDALIPNETSPNRARSVGRPPKESALEDDEWVLVERPSDGLSPHSAAGIMQK